MNKASIRGSKGHEQVFFFASELLLAKIYCAMNECLVCSFLSMPSLYFHLYPYLFLFYSTCSFSILLFFALCVIWMFLYTFVCFLMCLCLFCVNLICLTKVAAFVAVLSMPSKRELPASQSNTNTKTEWAKKTRYGACCSLGALIQVRVSLRVQSPIFLSLMLLAPYLAHISSFREPRCDKPAATQLR